MSKIDRQVQLIVNEIERQGDPRSMTKLEWVGFLESIIAECEFRLEGVKTELKEENGE